jgi:uncharacterized repeat protein (TIGR01451 family)
MHAKNYYTKLRAYLLFCTALLALSSSEVRAHGLGYTNGRLTMDPGSVTTLFNRAVPGATTADKINFTVYYDTVLLSGPVGYVTLYVDPGMTVWNAEFVNGVTSPVTVLQAAAPSPMQDGFGPRGAQAFTNWTATTGQGNLSVIYGDSGIFYSVAPLTKKFNPNADGSIATSTLGATIRTTSQLLNVTATHNMWDANQVLAFGAGAVGTNTPSTAPIVSGGTGVTPFRSGSAVAGPDVGYTLDNTGAVGPWNRISYPNSYTTVGSPSAAAAATVAGTIITAGTPTLAGASFPLSTSTNAVRWAFGAPRAPGFTYYNRFSLAFSSAILTSANGIVLAAEATGSDADAIGSNATNPGKDNSWRYHQPVSFVPTPAIGDLRILKEIIAVNGVPTPLAADRVSTITPVNIPVGAKLTYRIRYLNASTSGETGIVLSDVVPAQISTVCASITNISGSATAVSNTCPAAGSTVTFNIPNTLNVAMGGAVTFDVQTANNANLTVTNTAKIVSTRNATGLTSAVTTMFLPSPDMKMAKSHVGNFYLGQAGAQYTLIASNVGQNATNALVTVTDNLPAGLTATAASGTGWACTVGAPTTCTRSDVLAAGASYPPITLTVDVSSQAITPLVNSVTVSGGGEINTTNNTANDSTIVNPKISVSKLRFGGAATTLNFGFAGTNGLPTALTNIVTTADNVSTTTATLTNVPLTASGAAITLTETQPAASWRLTAVSCLDANAGVAVIGNTNPVTNLATFVGNVVTIPAANVLSTSIFNCTVTNTRFSGISLQKAWVSAGVNDAVTMTATGLTSLYAVANTPTEIDNGVLQTIAVGSVLTLAETFTTGSASNYSSTLACTGTSGLIGDTLTVGVLDAAIICTFTNKSIAIALTITKTDSKTLVTSSGTNDYVISVSNAGPGAADGVVVTDVVGAGLTCPAANPVTCTVSGAGAVCPAGPLTFANLISGLTVGTFPANSGLSFAYTCNVN